MQAHRHFRVLYEGIIRGLSSDGTSPKRANAKAPAKSKSNDGYLTIIILVVCYAAFFWFLGGFEARPKGKFHQ